MLKKLKKSTNRTIFQKFKPQKTPKQTQEEAIEYAKKLGEEMVESKKRAREAFMLRLLENARAINDARADWEDDETKEEDK